MQKKVVIQILTYRTADIEEKLHRFFESLSHVQTPVGGMAIIISDHPSPLGNLHAFLDGKVAALQEKGFVDIEVYKSEENRGYSGGHAYALEHFSLKYNPEYVYLLNEDTALTPDFLVNVVAYADAHPKTALVQSRIMLGNEREQMNTIGNAMHFLGFGYTIGHRRVYDAAASDEALLRGIPRFSPSGAGLLVRTSVLNEIGGLFDPSYFMYHEDLDLAWRARLRGYDIACDHDSVVYHYYEFSRSITKFYWMERNRIITHLTHLRLPTLLMILPPFLVMEAGTFLFSLRSGWWREKLRAWKYFFVVDHWKKILARRSMVQRIRTVSDASIFTNVTGIIDAQEVENSLLTYGVNPILAGYFVLLKKIIRW
jgi:GT2 family glycosyltransferase